MSRFSSFSNFQEQSYKIHHLQTLGKYNDTEAKNLLRQISTLVEPIMKKRKWSVGVLSEFFPSDPHLLGLNINGGEEIKIRLRPARNERVFLEYTELVGTLLHELTHIVRGPHDSEFYKILDELKDECELLMVQGRIPFQGDGYRLGGNDLMTGNSVSRQTLLDAHEKRIKNMNLLGGTRRLGGDDIMQKIYSPGEMAAIAAERRLQDSLWCGTEQAPVVSDVSNVEKPIDRNKRPQVQVIDLVEDEDEPSQKKKMKHETWMCPKCTLINPISVQACEVCEASNPETKPTQSPEIRQEPRKQPKYHPLTNLEWVCPECTLINSLTNVSCAACGTHKLKYS